MSYIIENILTSDTKNYFLNYKYTEENIIIIFLNIFLSLECNDKFSETNILPQILGPSSKIIKYSSPL